MPGKLFLLTPALSRRASSPDGAGFTYNPLGVIMPQSSLMDKYQSLQLHRIMGSEVNAVPG